MKFSKWFFIALIGFVASFGIFATASAQSGDPARGAQLFAQNCAVCHGDRGQGRVGATLAKDFPGIRVDALLKEIISNGVAGSVMPAWSKTKGGPMSDAEIDALVAFIQSLGHQAPPITPNPITPVVQPTGAPAVPTFPPGDPIRGSKIFADNCVVCHGDQGQGRIGATLQKDWAGINVDALITATIARGVAGSKMPAWSKANGGPLTDQDIADAAAFIRTLKKPAQPGPTPTPTATGGELGGVFGLVCFGLILVVSLVVLGLGLAGSRAKTE